MLQDRRRAAAAALEEAAIREMEHAEGVRRGFAAVVVPGEAARGAAGGRRLLRPPPAAAHTATDSADDGGDGGGGAGGSRKSAAVAEIERIAAARDARRLRHAAALVAREAAIAEHGAGDDVEVRRMINAFRAAAAAAGGGGGEAPGAMLHAGDATRRLLVCVRKRPMNARERSDYDVVTCAAGGTRIIVHEPRAKVDMTRFLENHVFNFDRVFSEAATGEDLYSGTLAPILKGVFRGGCEWTAVVAVAVAVVVVVA